MKTVPDGNHPEAWCVLDACNLTSIETLGFDEGTEKRGGSGAGKDPAADAGLAIEEDGLIGRLAEYVPMRVAKYLMYIAMGIVLRKICGSAVSRLALFW